MKNLITIINLCVIFGITTFVTRLDKLSEENADVQNKATGISASPIGVAKTAKSDLKTTKSNFKLLSNSEAKEKKDESVDFIKEMVQARMMDLEEGKIAAQRSTAKNVKEYGSLMVDDQNKMLDDLKKIAALKNVSLDKSLASDKSKALKDLKETHGKSFDKKFIKMMTIDHKRDVKKFREATRYHDADVQVFATKYLPVVESHLDKITALKKSH